MTERHSNPFRFGAPVGGEYYLPRPRLAKTVMQFLCNQISVVLIGPRRFGKTSFVLNLLDELEKDFYTCVCVDLFNITSHKDFLLQLLRALEAKKSLLVKIASFCKKLRPKMIAEIDPSSGQPSLGVTLESFSESDTKEAIQDALSELDKLGSRVIVVVDEFQKVSEIDDRGWLEATLRTHMQQQKNTAFLFTGSRKSLIYDMLNNQARPFYKSCQTIEFPSFGEEFTDWIIARFSTADITCEKGAIQNLRRLVQDTPNYVQMVCFQLAAEGVSFITETVVEQALSTVVKQNAYAYQTLLSSLTAMQQRALKLAAREGRQIFHKQSLAKYQITSGSALASAIRALKAKGILDEEGTSRGAVVFDDPLFATWLKGFGN